MIQIGVNEDVLVSKAEKNDQQTLVVSFKESGTEVKVKKELSVLEQMNEGSDATGSDGMGELNFMFFMPSMTKYGTEEAETGENILKSFLDLKNQLAHILKRFMTEKEIKFASFAGVAVNAADPIDIYAKLSVKANVEKVYANYTDQFIKMVTPFLNKSEKPARLFLHRKNAESHFGVLRKKFLDNQPFFEGMEIPISASKLYTKQTDATTKLHEPIEVDGIKYLPKFTDYELKKGLDDTSKSAAASETAVVNTSEIEDVNTLFNGSSMGQAETAGSGDFKLEE